MYVVVPFIYSYMRLFLPFLGVRAFTQGFYAEPSQSGASGAVLNRGCGPPKSRVTHFELLRPTSNLDLDLSVVSELALSSKIEALNKIKVLKAMEEKKRYIPSTTRR